MIIKKFSASTMKEAMLKVKEELGNEAIILKSEKISQGGVFDFSESKYTYEITAAIDKLSVKDKEQGINFNRSDKKIPLQQKFPDKALKSLSEKKYNDIPGRFHFVELKSELLNIDKKLDKMSEQLKKKEQLDLPETLVPYYNRLVNSYVEDKIVKDIMMQVYMEFKGEEFSDENLIRNAVINAVKKRLNVKEILGEKVYAGPQVVALVGPTGVGKTTTLAKLAFNEKFFGKKKVGLITADTYRVAAVEQLKTYSNITQIPLEVIYKPEQIRKAINRFNDYDIVLVDTAGRSQRNQQQLQELQQILYEGSIMDVCLVLSLTTRTEDQKDVLKRFAKVKYSRLIFTKLDETSGFGGLLNAAVDFNIPLSAVTYGQNVPDDITKADETQVARMILWPEKVIFN